MALGTAESGATEPYAQERISNSGAMGAPFSGSRLVAWYAIFAAISIVANLGSQKLAFWLYQGPFAVLLSVCVGTAVGLIIKYALDKAWIFHYPHRSVAHGVQTFVMYVVMGLGTTFVFWGVEFAADALFHSETARLCGGALGLILGYFTKYQLDKRFVFA
ncbi:GtrA family protein [Paraburkholderia sp.]|jgi:putative flippase GtrA|uniref:GtrA family protein n=1 Tax=Paraburkholderia sp. TaxID=1926495 RepID=UPI002F3EC38C